MGRFRIEFNLTHALLCCYRTQNFIFCSLGLFWGTGQLRFTAISSVWISIANKCESAHLHTACDLILSVPSSRMEKIKSTNFSYWLKSWAFSCFSVYEKTTFSHPCASRKFNCRFYIQNSKATWKHDVHFAFTMFTLLQQIQSWLLHRPAMFFSRVKNFNRF